MRKSLGLLAILAAFLVVGCGDDTQKAAQDSQAEIQKEMKASGDDKNAY